MVLSINNYHGDEEQLKAAFGKVLNKIVKDKKEGVISEDKNYGYGRFHKGKISVYCIHVQSCNHLFDDNPEVFGIIEDDGHLIREYFHNVPLERAINDLYGQFPEIFEGEPYRFVKAHPNFDEISKDVPFFED